MSNEAKYDRVSKKLHEASLENAELKATVIELSKELEWYKGFKTAVEILTGRT